jgi:hypothetical protein
MTLPQQDPASADRRTFYRCAVEDERFACLQVGETQFPALIADESVQGFGILVHPDAWCEVGKLVMLKTESGWSECKVMNSRLLDDVLLDEDDPESGSPLRIGLMRVKDIESDAEQRIGWRQLLTTGPRKVAVAALGHPGGGAVVFTLLLIVVAGIVIWSLERPGLVRVTRGEPSDEMPGVIEPRKKIIVGEDTKAPPRRRKSLAQSAEDVVKEVADLATEIRVPQHVIRRSLPTHLLDPEVVQRLALNERQLVQLRRLIQEQQALALLEQQAQTVSDAVQAGAEIGDRVVHREASLQLGRKALEVLDDDQRRQWEDLLASQAAAADSAPAETQQKTSDP